MGECPKCQSIVDLADFFCTDCGRMLMTDTDQCSDCGAYPESCDDFCVQCGANLPPFSATSLLRK
jgi:hypothetical protein